MRGVLAALLVATLAAGACGSEAHAPSAADSVWGRPFVVFVPKSYRRSVPAPLVVLLHAYTKSGALEERYLGLRSLADQRGFLYAVLDGTKDATGNRFWNATDACCNFSASTVDDSAYVAAVIERLRKAYDVDPRRIYVVGHSNGGFMAYRMACDHADEIAAVVSLAGATYADRKRCRPKVPVSVLEIHGTADPNVLYGGGRMYAHDYPGAPSTVRAWAAYDGCRSTPVVSLGALDLDRSLRGTETSTSRFPACSRGAAVELWTIPGGGHSPALSPVFATSIMDFLAAHPKR